MSAVIGPYRRIRRESPHAFARRVAAHFEIFRRKILKSTTPQINNAIRGRSSRGGRQSVGVDFRLAPADHASTAAALPFTSRRRVCLIAISLRFQEEVITGERMTDATSRHI